MQRVIDIIDRFNGTIGSIAAWIVVPLAVVRIIEVFMRSFLNNPTIWVYDMSWMLFSAFFLLGGGFTMLHKRHVRIDLIYRKFPETFQVYYELFFFVVIFLPVMLILGVRSVQYAADAFQRGINLSTTTFVFPAGPIRAMIPIAFFLLAIQGVAEVLRNIQELIKPKTSEASDAQ